MRTVKSMMLAGGMVLCTMAYAGDGFKNPVISGFHPDPSVCRVDSNYYLVNSSFEYFPGVPIFHSTDMVHWEQIGNCLTRENQVNLKNTPASCGIYAPTIRYNNGVFYMITTNVLIGNFFVYTIDPAGEWSNPIFVKQGGIDPSLYFEDDKCYMVSNPNDGIVLSEIDIKTGKLLSDQKVIWRGTGGRYPEGPHIYKKDGWYYLLISEGGTEYGHKVTVARSRSIGGPYESNPANPILTHINMEAQSSPIQGTGHADLIQAHDGSWWVVFLGFRPQSGLHHLLGRETFLAPVTWENGWPVVNGGKPIELDMACKTLPLHPVEHKNSCDFNDSQLPVDWVYLRNPSMENYSLTARQGYLRLKPEDISLDMAKSPTFVAHRQEDINCTVTTAVELTNATSADEAGLSVYMMNNYHYDVYVKKAGKKGTVAMRVKLGSMEHKEVEFSVKSSKIYLRCVADKDFYTFYYSEDNQIFKELGKIDARFISSETAGGFTGVVFGLYATSTNAQTAALADFDWFNYVVY